MEKLMESADSIHRVALEILSQVMDEKLGASNLVSREVMRAFQTGMETDLNRASLLFDTLPGWQKNEVYKQARYRAYESVNSTDISSARIWQTSSSEVSNDLRSGVLQTPPPRFLIDRR
jgi:hypothetical protein